MRSEFHNSGLSHLALADENTAGPNLYSETFEEAEAQDSGDGESIAVAESVKVVKRLYGSREPGYLALDAKHLVLWDCPG